MAECEKVCEHIHLPLQAGSDRILRKMNRRYTREDYLRLVDRLRERIPDIAITTDLIVGFPGETEEDFRASCDIVEKAGFCKVHVFRYSKRKGTKAAEMDGQIPPDVKAARSEELIRISEATAARFFAENLGSTRRVLFERYDDETGLAEGLTDNYIKVYCETDPSRCNSFADVELIELYRDGVKGRIRG